MAWALYNHLLATSRNGVFFNASLALGAKSALAFWPLITCAVIVPVADGGGRRPTAQPDQAEASGMWTTDPNGGTLRRLGG